MNPWKPDATCWFRPSHRAALVEGTILRVRAHVCDIQVGHGPQSTFVTRPLEEIWGDPLDGYTNLLAQLRRRVEAARSATFEAEEQLDAAQAYLRIHLEALKSMEPRR